MSTPNFPLSAFVRHRFWSNLPRNQSAQLKHTQPGVNLLTTSTALLSAVPSIAVSSYPHLLVHLSNSHSTHFAIAGGPLCVNSGIPRGRQWRGIYNFVPPEVDGALFSAAFACQDLRNGVGLFRCCRRFVTTVFCLKLFSKTHFDKPKRNFFCYSHYSPEICVEMCFHLLLHYILQGSYKWCSCVDF